MDSNPCAREKETWRKRWIVMQHRSPVHYRLGHRGQLVGVVVLVVCIRACRVMHMLILIQWRIGGDISCDTVTYSSPGQHWRSVCDSGHGLLTKIVGSGAPISRVSLRDSQSSTLTLRLTLFKDPIRDLNEEVDDRLLSPPPISSTSSVLASSSSTASDTSSSL